jgi:alpha-acetolactate decarboxylase
LVGLYSGEALEGVVSHPGERFHVHFVDPSLGFSGHVDGYAVARGATLKLPVR